MNQKIICFEDYGIRKVQLFAAPEDVDIEVAFKEALKEAADEGITCLRSEIPEKYLERAGLERMDVQILEHDNCKISQTPAERAGIFRPECRFCDSFDAGICLKYGGACDPTDEEDCLHCSGLAFLLYDNKSIQSFVVDDSTLSAGELAETVKAEYGSIQKIMDRPDFDRNLWSLAY